MKSISFFCILLFAVLFKAASQCSDAGVCAIGKKSDPLSHQAGVSYNFGRSGKADDLTFHSINFEATIRVLQDANIIATFPWSRQSGPFGSASGIGDMSVFWSQQVWTDGVAQVSVELGGKLATANVEAGDLPQAYQSGLGTNDLIVGASYVEESLNAAVGYQLSRGRSNNSVTRLRRGDDFFLRAGYSGELEEFQYALEALAIKRLEESSVLDSTSPTGTFVNIPGSDQFQVNILGKLVLLLDGSKNARLIAAVPLLQRNVNVDGLTRSLTLSFGFSFIL
ncbi:MAG: hypothetical protein HY562_08100 [Ignavibacteriales bacterium]|nr:hypothetical protein [Ignavibacteriales bacterium]